MGFESLLTELLVTTILHGVGLESVRVAVDVMVLREEIGDWEDGEGDCEGNVDLHLHVWNLSLRDEVKVLRDIMSHLRS